MPLVFYQNYIHAPMNPDHSVMDIQTLSAKEKELLQNVLAKTGWDLPKATRLLQIPIAELRKQIKEHGLKQNPAT